MPGRQRGPSRPLSEWRDEALPEGEIGMGTVDIDDDLAAADDDLAAIFDGGRGDDELAELRSEYPLFAISHTRSGWSAWPVWLTEDADRLEADTGEELADQIRRCLDRLRPGAEPSGRS
jgi:hypothetical protein